MTRLAVSRFHFIGQFEIHPRNNYEPMRVEETRKFKIDKTIKKDCGLPGEGIIEIEIKKEKSIVFASTFRMVKPDLGSRVAFIHCNKGYVALVKAQGKAQNCGIARILMQLCINEEGFHNVASNYKNEAVILIGKYVQECLKKESCMANHQQLTHEKEGNLKLAQNLYWSKWPDHLPEIRFKKNAK